MNKMLPGSQTPLDANRMLVALQRSSTATGSHAVDSGDEDLVVVPDDFDEEVDAILLEIFSFLVTTEDLGEMAAVSKKWRELIDSPSLYQALQSVNPDGSVNWVNFKNLGFKNKGTEGECFKCLERSTGKILAMKRARVYPDGEGVPYYMVRELAVLKGMKHDHITPLELVSLSKNKLHSFFPYVDETLDTIIHSTDDGRTLPETAIRKVLYQLLDAVAYSHRRGVLHRNLKPKHLLVTTSDPENLSDATLQISDFALVRATGITGQAYTTEAVTLWYRAPEILMGVDTYSSAVDMWSIGCIFAEMAHGQALFPGDSEIDQLFQIFSKLSTPTPETWPDFASLPNHDFEFPHWKHNVLASRVPELSNIGMDLLKKLLVYNPDERITAEEALHHSYFFTTPQFLPSTIQNCLDQMWQTVSHLWASPTPKNAELFHSNMRQMELESRKETDLPCCPGIEKMWNPSHRAMLVDWMIEVVDVFELSPRALFLAVNYTDRYLNAVVVDKSQLQLVGATCLQVASKCEDVNYIGTVDLTMCSDNVYTSKEVLDMEEKVLNTLSFELFRPTALDFLNAYECLLPPILKKTSMLAHYLLELTLQEYHFVKYLPSVLSTCCLSMAMYTIDGVSMTTELANVSQYNWSDLEDCMEELQTLFSSVPSTCGSLFAVNKRYAKPERCEVVNIPSPVLFEMSF
ncbi:hypothetical protein DVH05_022919 [Phytophthora capsici]|nr:hypothetical protein DVH05_022919 [Phytophthora capsici]